MVARPAAAVDDLWDDDMTGVVVAGCPVLLVRLDGVVRAYVDRCPHLGVTLSTGGLAGGVITCPAHCYQYDARTGAGVNPASTRLRALPVEIRADAILVDVDVDVDAVEAAP